MAEENDDNNGQKPKVSWGGNIPSVGNDSTDSDKSSFNEFRKDESETYDSVADGAAVDEPTKGKSDTNDQTRAEQETDRKQEKPRQDRKQRKTEPADDLNIRRGEVKRVTRQRRQDDAEDGLFRLTLIGFPAAGKTQFLNGLKQILNNQPWFGGPFSGRLGSKLAQGIYEALGWRGSYRIDPGIAREGGQTAGIWAHYFRWEKKAKRGRDTDEVRPTPQAEDAENGNEEERRARAQRENSRSFVVYDASGETLETAVDIDGEQQTVPGELYEVVADSDALIILLPSNFLLAPEGNPRRIAAQIQTHLREELAKIHGTAASTVGGGAIDPLAQFDRQDALTKRAEHINTLTNYEEILSTMSGFPAGTHTATAASKTADEKLEDERTAEEACEEFEEKLKQLKAFRDELNQIVDISSVMRRGNLTFAEYSAMSDTEVGQLRGRGVSSAPLAYFAMSKSDTVISDQAPIVPLKDDIIDLISELARRDGVTSDKGEDIAESEVRKLLDKYAPEVFSTANQGALDKISDLFAGTKVDFLTTCQPDVPNLLLGDGGGDYDKETPRISEHQANGVDAVIHWVQYARARRTHAGGFISRNWRAFWRRFDWLERAMAKTRVAGVGLIGAILIATSLTAGYFSSNRLSGRTTAAQADQSVVAPINAKSRYPSEVSFLQRQHPFFENGRPSETIRPWHYIPSDIGGYFSTVGQEPEDRARRQIYDAVLASTSRWNTRRSVPESSIANVIGKLDSLQQTEEQRAASAGDSQAGRRSFSYYHMGIARYRRGLNAALEGVDADGAFGRAALEFGGLVDLLEGQKPSNEEGETRLLGMKIAAHHAKGLAELLDESTDATTAKASLQRAVDLIPAKDDTARNRVSTSSSFFVVRSRRDRSPANYSSFDIYADLLAAYIADFDAAKDTNPDGELATHLADLAPIAAEIPNEHRLRTNLAIAGALVGSPLEDIPSSTDATLDRDKEAIEIALAASSGEGVWNDIDDLRASFAKGNADDVEELLNDAGSANRLTSVERNLVNQVASDVVVQEREVLRPRGRSETLAPYIGKVPGFTEAELARDVAGGEWAYQAKSIAPWVIATLAALFFFWLGARAAETAYVQTSPLHRKDRLKRKAATPADGDYADDAVEV